MYEQVYIVYSICTCISIYPYSTCTVCVYVHHAVYVTVYTPYNKCTVCVCKYNTIDIYTVQ